MQPFEISSFLKSYSAGTYTPADHDAFTNWLKSASDAEIECVLDQYGELIETSGKSLHNLHEIQIKDISVGIEAVLNQYELGKDNHKKSGLLVAFTRFSKLIVAASIILFAAAFFWMTRGRNKEERTIVRANAVITNEILPGTNKATLVLANGTAINLDDEKSGHITQQGNAMVEKPSSGQLRYIATNNTPSEKLFNTLITPRGGQYTLILPDGSKVWLNASSSIKYPTSFTGTERKVEVSGEVYFEIAHNALMPFKATTVDGAEIKVFGTHFNINAYNDEATVKTSLLEGSIAVTKANKTVVLIPGQQSQSDASGNTRVTNEVDMDEVVAWKNGYFSFNKADLPSVMRQIARWYDVAIKYEGKIPERLFGGKIDRNSNASEVLKILAESKVHFSIEGKNIIVKP